VTVLRFLVALVAALNVTCSIAAAAPSDKLSRYTYEDTKRLVAFVEDAASLIEHEGAAAFPKFAQKGSRWFNEEHYLFIYTADGTNVFHPFQRAFVGKNLIALRDMNGKPMVRLIADIGKRSEPDASGWVFYLWEDGTELAPQWKSSYVRKAIAPNGKTYLVGSGLFNMKTEKAWVQDRVDLAAQVLKAQGPARAFKQFSARSTPFVFLDTYIFVLDMHGTTIVDPAYPTMAGRNLSGFKDATGMYVIQIVLNKLQNADTAWVQYLWPKPGESLPSRKLMYARKVNVHGKTFVVGSDFFLPTPIWMRL
jgi:signal transduction histidine kinase